MREAPLPPTLTDEDDAQYIAEADAAIRSAQKKVTEFPQIVRECLFQYFHDQRALTAGGYDDTYSVDEARRWVEHGYLKWEEDEDQRLTLRRDQPEIDEAVASLRQVDEMVFDSSFFDGTSKAGDWIKPFLKSKYGISDPTFQLRPVWEALDSL